MPVKGSQLKSCLDRHLVLVSESEFHSEGKTPPAPLNLCDTEKMPRKTALPLNQVTLFSHRVTNQATLSSATRLLSCDKSKQDAETPNTGSVQNGSCRVQFNKE